MNKPMNKILHQVLLCMTFAFLIVCTVIGFTSCNVDAIDYSDISTFINYKYDSTSDSYVIKVDNLTSKDTITTTHFIIPSTYNGKSVTSIDRAAFAHIKSLISITIPDSVTQISDSAFEGCTGLTSIVIPDSVTYIGNTVFKGCTGLTSITIGTGVTSIGNYFMGNDDFPSECNPNAVYISNIAKWCDISFNGFYANPLAFGHNLYLNGELVTNLDMLPTTVTSINKYAFSGCDSLTEISLPNSITEIGEGAFINCTNLTKAELKTPISKIGIATFAGCLNLTKLTIQSAEEQFDTFHIGKILSYYRDNRDIQDSLSEIEILGGIRIDSLAFASCKKITSIKIPITITSIGNQAFYGCENLTNIIFEGTKAQWKAIKKEVIMGGSAVNILWNANTSNFTIHCTDGDLDKNGNEI